MNYIIIVGIMICEMLLSRLLSSKFSLSKNKINAIMPFDFDTDYNVVYNGPWGHDICRE